ncbi:MAG: tetratricopeptide repeat protein [Deltaproteobacteria bacterium]|nr:tetratricopeptide repeat protein [Deltaproteobacteria bacterium]
MTSAPGYRAASSLALLPLAVLAALSTAGCQRVQARSLAREGNELYRAGKLDEALTKFDEAARLDPKLAVAFLHLGYAGMSLATSRPGPAAKKYADAATHAFARYMKLRPSDERGAKFYLQTLLDAGQHEAALAFLLEQHRRHPKDVSVVSSLGMVASKAGRFDEALGWYEKRAALQPKDPQAHHLIGSLCWQRLHKNAAVTGEARLKVANRGIAALERAVALRPDYGEALVFINLLYRERALGQPDAAAKERDLERAREVYRRAEAALKRAAGQR